MGDGGVACMPLQHNTIMERFPIPENATTICSVGNSNTAAATTSAATPTTTTTNSKANTNGNGTTNGVNSKTRKVLKKVIKVKKVITVKKTAAAAAGKGEFGLAKTSRIIKLTDKAVGKQKEVTVVKENELIKGSKDKEKEKEKEEKSCKDTGNGLGSADNNKVQSNKEEVEEGELGTWPVKPDVENGEFLTPEKARRSETEKGEILGDKWRKGDIDKGEVVSGSGRWRKGDFTRDDVERGEFIPDRWQNKDNFSSFSKFRGRYDPSGERTPPSGKYFNEDFYRRKEFRSGSNQHGKSSSKWEIGPERNTRISSKIVDEEGSYNSEYSNGKNHGREFSSGNRLKRYGAECDINERKHYGDYGDYASSKSRRISEDSTRSGHPEHYSGRPMERFYRNSSSTSSSRIPPSDKYASRNHEPSLSSKVVYDHRHGRSPGHSERSPRDRSRYYDHRSPSRRERSPYGRERSPYDKRRHYDYRSPHSERSSQDRYHDRRDRTPNVLDRSPIDRGRTHNHRETSRKGSVIEKRNSQVGNKGPEDKLSERDSSGRDSQFSGKESQDRNANQNLKEFEERKDHSELCIEEQSQSPCKDGKESLEDGPPPEELQSMEEDMDICDTPPHTQQVSDISTGKWFYLDCFGLECGPSRLCDLKSFVDEGYLVSDHLIKRSDCNRWVTIENAVSPVVTANFPSLVSDTVTQLVSPPEAPGNVLADTGDMTQSASEKIVDMTLQHHQVFLDDGGSALSECFKDITIDERVGALLDGFTVTPGRELETVGEALQMTFDHLLWEGCEKQEGVSLNQLAEQHVQLNDDLSKDSDMKQKEVVEVSSGASLDKDQGCTFLVDSADWFSGRWSCKGGDWKRNDEALQDRISRRKLVVNDGFPLCQMPKSGSEDPRWHRKDDLYFPSQSRRLDLLPWAFSCPDEKNDPVGLSKQTPAKAPLVRGVRGTMLPVVRINACVVKDHGSFVSEPRAKVRGKEKHSSRSARAHSVTNDGRRLMIEGDSQSIIDQDSHGSWKSISSISTPKDRLCTVHDLQLHLGEWYYLDGSGHERGPLSFSELQVLASQGTIQKFSSVFRKFDRVWVPIISDPGTSEATVKIQPEDVAPPGVSSVTPSKYESASEINTNSTSFHGLHPQFIGFTRGKLHELVMKSYKSREFAAAINDVLDPWLSAKQPKKEIDDLLYRKSEIDARAGKRARLQVEESEDDYATDEDMQAVQKDETTFEELCADATFHGQTSAGLETQLDSWGLLDGRMLARVFHFLRSDMKSLVFSSLTCKHWRAAVSFYKDISTQVDLSHLGPDCTDSMIRNIMSGYNKEKIKSVVLVGCKNITSALLEDIMRSFPFICSIDIRGCYQLKELVFKFPDVCWIRNRGSRCSGTGEESYSKLKSLRQISEKPVAFNKIKGLNSDADDFGELKEYFNSVNKRDPANQLFRHSLYKRSKLFDARKSSSIPSRDARIRRWAIKKSESGYKRMEGFLASGLRDIMTENTFDFFVPKVAEIEKRMRNGYYTGRGLRSVKDDISRMCRDAIKAKTRGAGDMNRVITLFLKLASHLEDSSKFSYERDKLMKSWRDDLSAGSGYAPMKNKKKFVTEKKNTSRSTSTNLANGIFDFGDSASDREIRKRLSRLNRKSMDSGSETSDGYDKSSEDGRSDSESTTSETESDLDFRSENRIGDSRGLGFFMEDDSFDSIVDDREWGARMTKASLVPPVTRKYEVIDQYVIVADEEDVRRKMCVSLSDDYAEKLDAQTKGTEELDMELPEVKEFKPRKQLGYEVIEQEVYGIDPYTHNLLLDSMPDEQDWLLLDKQIFIEDMLLRALNKQVRHFTGTGNTPMIFTLQPIVEEIEKVAEEDCDVKTMKMCQGILKAMDSRLDDNYVAYRKGLGVVCNKEGGFEADDFVVEFLGEVYPAWKWFEKQDGIRSLQKNSKDPAPEFYNIYLERPKGDADGYDLVVVDAMHKANYASRICHSCRPNCEAKVTAVDGQYQIGIYTLREIRYGEEITFDYNSVTESKEEYEASVCLCGSQVCRGSYLNLTGEGAFQKVFKEWHAMLDRHQLMLEACELNSVSEDDYLDLGRAGLGSCLLGGLPDWVVAYSARLVRFINFERTKLPEEILRHNLEEKRKYYSEVSLEVERSDAEVQAEGVYNQRLQNLAVTLDKVRYVMRCVFGDPKKAPPPLERLTPEESVSFLWKGEGSLVEELLQCMAPHVEADVLNDLKSKIRAHDPLGSDNIRKQLQKSLLWLRDEVRSLPCTYKCRHDAAADLIHVYAYTRYLFKIREYNTFTSQPVHISPLDLGPKFNDKLGAGIYEYRKAYGENYCLGQLIYWHIQTNAQPDVNLARASRGCLSLPDISSFYAKVQKPSQQRIYGPKTVKLMLERMDKYPHKPWPKDQIWTFKSSPKVIGSPMLDAVMDNSSIDKEMVHWLKHRHSVYQAMWDR
ncbi:Histone-lysine N-methyltransferase ATXR3 [Euphorbia peplus]|nr:Histone-lysine N-methyltransferase ATXR3 [Euphorbia peplus]